MKTDTPRVRGDRHSHTRVRPEEIPASGSGGGFSVDPESVGTAMLGARLLAAARTASVLHAQAIGAVSHTTRGAGA